MEWEFTEEQQMIRQMIARLAAEKIAPRAAEIDETNDFPQDIKEIMAQNGLLKMGLPEKYGGIGAGVTTLCIVMEEVAKVSLSATIIFFSIHLIIEMLLAAGTEEQQERFFPRIAEGDKIGCMAVTEPNAGSDLSSMQTRAVLDGNTYVVNGTKCFLTAGGVADFYGLFASTQPEKKGHGISGFMVERDTPGLSIGKLENPMGMRGAANVEVIFDGTRIPKDNLLGKEGEGLKILLETLETERLWVSAQAVGLAQGAMEYAARYAQERVQFGRAIAEFQAIQFMLAEMATQIEAARSLLYRAASLKDQGRKDTRGLAAMAKCFATDMAMRATTDAVQILGGYGYMKDHPVERMMRDAKATQIFAGTNQIQKIVIARSLMGKHD
ncbi:MAG: acyl-CoA dehydrogenase [Nitrospinae bacterium RIFCSPLOWO2_12_FULL_45_22]|nr:MAG: acyl-CoA dehydrogenase [Nitrospinae bacterium RIFCSPLOWO2_12_FULL_45_22]